MKNTNFREFSVLWQNDKFYKIIKFDGITVDLQTTKHGGGYLTTLPISPAEFRKEEPTKAKVEVEWDNVFTTFIITDDWGKVFRLSIKNQCKEDIEKAILGMTENGLLPIEFFLNYSPPSPR